MRAALLAATLSCACRREAPLSIAPDDVRSRGEDAAAPAPSDVASASPLATTGAAAAARFDRLVAVGGVLQRLEPARHGEGDHADAHLKLADGAVVRIEDVPRARCAALVGAPITVVGRLSLEKGARGPYAIDLVLREATRICAGVTATCSGSL